MAPGLVRTAAAISCSVLLAGCGAEAPDSSQVAKEQTAAGPTLTGRHTFAIVPAQSRASYRATEEFFPGALRRLGIEAGKSSVVGSTEAIEGQFELDPDHPTGPVGENSFAVQLTTLQSDQQRRDDYVREIRDDGGPSFDAYPVARFKATAIDGVSVPAEGGRQVTFKLTGDLSVREMTRQVVFDVRSELRGRTLTGRATTTIRLSDFGIGPIDFYDTLKVADEIGLEVDFTARAAE
jgi:polyisoprenoid-binding protein YceI